MGYNASLSGKKLLAKIVNGVKQPTVFCPFERLVSCTIAQDVAILVLVLLALQNLR